MALPTRSPVSSPPKVFAQPVPEILRVMGVDPGFASMGVAILEKVGSQAPRALVVKPLKTAKADAKTLRNIRVADDDERRYREVWDCLTELADEYHPSVLVMENYVPFKAVGGGAWKTCRACGLVMGWTLARPGMVFLSYGPQDLKRKIVGKLDASKEDVQAALELKVADLWEHISRYPKGVHEHLADAAGHAYLAFAEIQKLRQLMGVGGGQ